MRSPRALIPLLSVCGAAAVVTAAVTGAGVDGRSGGGPAHADGLREVPDAMVTAMTWNVCGDAAPGCPLGARPAELTRRIVQQMNATEVGGRTVRTNAVFLQEVCAGQVQTLRRTGRLSRWSWAFAPFTKGPSCAQGQGRLGVAVGTEAPLTAVRRTRLPSPPRLGRVALCGEVAAWSTRVCATRLSSSGWGEDPRGEWRRRQVRALNALVGTAERVLVGGDLVERPESAALDPLYHGLAECDQGSGGARTGARTVQDWRGTATGKADYLFISRSASVSCGVPGGPVRASDHRPLSAVIRFP